MRQVDTKYISAAFTEKNRIIMGSFMGPSTDSESLFLGEDNFQLPLANNPESIARCHEMSGRAASKRRRTPPPTAFDVSLWLPEVTDAQTSAGEESVARPAVTEGALEVLTGVVCAVRGIAVSLSARVQQFDSFVQPGDGRRSSAFRIEYIFRDIALLDRSGFRSDLEHENAEREAMYEVAALVHSYLLVEIPRHFPGSEVR